MHGEPCSRMNRAREQPGIPHRFGTKIEFRKCEYVNAIYIITREPWKHLISLHHLIIMWKILSSSFLGSTRWTNDGFEEEDELFQLLKVFYYAGLGEDKIYRMGTQTASRQEIWQHSCANGILMSVDSPPVGKEVIPGGQNLRGHSFGGS